MIHNVWNRKAFVMDRLFVAQKESMDKNEIQKRKIEQHKLDTNIYVKVSNHWSCHDETLSNTN